MVVFDSWLFSAALIRSCCDLGHHVTCQIKSDKKVLLDNGESIHVRNYAKQFDVQDFKKIGSKVRGKKRLCLAVDKIVRIDKAKLWQFMLIDSAQ
jgi:hypothetical protein